MWDKFKKYNEKLLGVSFWFSAVCCVINSLITMVAVSMPGGRNIAVDFTLLAIFNGLNAGLCFWLIKCKEKSKTS